MKKQEVAKKMGEKWKYGKPDSKQLAHNMRASHKFTESCCGAAVKEKK